MRILKRYQDGSVDVVAKMDPDLLRKQLRWLYGMEETWRGCDEYEGLLAAVEYLCEACDDTVDVHGKAVELAFSKDAALVFLPNPDRKGEFVVACGYDKETKSWSSGSYFFDVAEAVVDFDKKGACDAVASACGLDPYEAYRLRWMLAHGKSLSDYTSALDAIAEDASFCGENLTAEQCASAFEEDYGFEGELWACRAEWEETRG